MANNNNLKLSRKVHSDDKFPMVSGDGQRNEKKNVGEERTYFVCDTWLCIETKTKF